MDDNCLVYDIILDRCYFCKQGYYELLYTDSSGDEKVACSKINASGWCSSFTTFLEGTNFNHSNYTLITPATWSGC